MKFVTFIFLFLTFDLFAETSSTDEAPYRVTSTENHDMRVVNSGLASLYARVDMIRRAKTSIDLESFIFNPDTAGKIILNELAAAAKRGVKVRILVDRSPSQFQLNEHYAKAIKAQGIDIRYYNPASVFQLSKVQYRNHRKLMVRDGEEAITGGRNIADEYFDLSKSFNFLDRDATVEGEIVKSMDGTFENFWNSEMAEVPGEPRRPTPNGGMKNDTSYQQRLNQFERMKKKAGELFQADEETEKALKLVEESGKENFFRNEKHPCPKIAFASDREGNRSGKEGETYRLLRKEISKWMDEEIKDEVVLDTPYFLPSPLTQKLLDYLQSKKAKVKLFTNSLASTDAIHVAAVFNDSVMSYTPYDEFKAFVYKGNYSGEQNLPEETKNAAWGTHSKTIVFNDSAFMVGSFNLDNRSNSYNTELAVFCSGSPELTTEIKTNIMKRMENAVPLDSNGDPTCGQEGALPEVGFFKKLMYYLVKIPSHMFEDLL